MRLICSILFLAIVVVLLLLSLWFVRMDREDLFFSISVIVILILPFSIFLVISNFIVTCGNCGKLNSTTYYFCEDCSKPLKEEKVKCSNCGEKIDSNYSYCWNCGEEK